MQKIALFLTVATLTLIPLRTFAAMLPYPKLVAIPDTKMIWEWEYANPYKWNAYVSTDNKKTWYFDDWKFGDSRSYAPDGGSSYMRIAGFDQNGKRITKFSNAVRPDDVLSYVPKLSPQYPDELVWKWNRANPYK